VAKHASVVAHYCMCHSCSLTPPHMLEYGGLISGFKVLLEELIYLQI